MGLAVLLVEHQELPLRTETIERLADLGITRLSLTRDGGTAAVVLEGWAFDPARSAEAAAAALGVSGRVFHPLLEVAVSHAGPRGPGRTTARSRTLPKEVVDAESIQE
jgi:hypothetical protein